MKHFSITSSALLLTALVGVSGCAAMKNFFGANTDADRRKPISNPFGEYYSSPKSDPNQRVTLRTKKGERSVEVELPGSAAEMTDFVIPVSPAFKDSVSGRGLASADGTEGANSSAGAVDDHYMEKNQSQADREILASLPGLKGQDENKRREIENGLGLMPSEDGEIASGSKSYLAQLDHIKQLYRGGRYEAALLEADDSIRVYPTDPRLHQMRGTLLDRLGKTDLALRSWTQALRFDPSNETLRKFVERKQQKRSIAGK